MAFLKLLDTNLWLALTLATHTHHQAARSWLEQQPLPNSITFCRSTQQSLLRLMRNTGVLAVYGDKALSNAAAWGCYEAFMGDERIVSLPEPSGLISFGKNWRRENQFSKALDGFLDRFAKRVS